MINVMVKVTGSDAEIANINEGGTVAEAIADLGYGDAEYSIKVNGEPANLSTVLQEGQMVTLSEKVKGGIA